MAGKPERIRKTHELADRIDHLAELKVIELLKAARRMDMDERRKAMLIWGGMKDWLVCRLFNIPRKR